MARPPEKIMMFLPIIIFLLLWAWPWEYWQQLPGYINSIFIFRTSLPLSSSECSEIKRALVSNNLFLYKDLSFAHYHLTAALNKDDIQRRQLLGAPVDICSSRSKLNTQSPLLSGPAICCCHKQLWGWVPLIRSHMV